MERKYKNATLSETLSNLVGAEGIKTDVSVKLNPTTIPVLILSVMVAVVAGIIIANAISKVITKK